MKVVQDSFHQRHVADCDRRFHNQPYRSQGKAPVWCLDFNRVLRSESVNADWELWYSSKHETGELLIELLLRNHPENRVAEAVFKLSML